jgi:glycosyltransferase involved in cell wall biosynthesis
VLDPAYAGEFLHEVRHVVLPRERMWGAYRAADIVLNLSQSEGLPNAVAEAMWVGCPVLAAEHSGNRAALAEAGLYFRDGAELRRQLVSLWANGALRRQLAGTARQRALEIFRPEGERKAHVRAYRDALA